MNGALTNLFDLTGKNAIVTGGAGILGQRFCRGLAAYGAHVAVCDVNEAAAQQVAAEITAATGAATLGVACDVADPASVRAAVAQVVAAWGAIHILHNNAASKSKGLRAWLTSFEDSTLDEWREIMAVNIDGMYLMAQAVGLQMIAQGTGGSIVQTCSIYGIMAPDQRIYKGSDYMGHEVKSPAVYSASKAAVLGFTKYLAAYWADKKIRVNALTPGGVESGQNDEFKARYGARVPLGRMAEADEMVGALIYLASDASSYVTGTNLIVDGGLNAW